MSKNGSRPQRKNPRTEKVPKPGSKPPGDGEGRNKAKKSIASAVSRQDRGRPAPLDINPTGKSSDESSPPLAPAGSVPPPSSGGPPSSSGGGGPPSSTSSVVVSRAKSPKMKFFIGVNAQDVLCLEYGIGHSWNVKSSKTVKWNEHSISAMSRDAAILDILVREAKGKKTLRVLDWFGSPRNLKFMRAVRGCTIEWVCAPDTAIQGDAARTVKDVRRELDDGETFDVVIIQDVYQFGPKPTDRLGPDGIRKILGYAGAGHCYFIGRMFNGEAGADNYGNGKEEMVWFREGGLIVASPEPRGQLYAPHPDVNWMLNRHQDGVDSSELGKYGPYTVFRLAKSKVGAQVIVLQSPPPALVGRIAIPGPGWLSNVIRSLLDKILTRFGVSATSWLRSVFGLKKFMVHYGVYSVLAPKFSLKIPNGQILDAAKHSVQESLARDFEMKCLMIRFPSVFMEIVEGTTTAVLYGTRTANVMTGLALRVTHAEVENSLVKMRGSTVEPAKPGYAKQIAFGVLGVVVVSVLGKKAIQVFQQLGRELLKKVDGPLPLGLATIARESEPPARTIADLTPQEWREARQGFLNVYSLTSLAEELIGWKFPNLKVGYAVLEFFNNAHYEGGYHHRWLPLAMHLVNSVLVRKWGKRGLVLAICLHVANNAFATIRFFANQDYPNNPFRVTGTGTIMYGWRQIFGLVDVWGNFVSAYGKGELVEAGPGKSVPLPPGTTLPPYQSTLESVDWPIRGSLSIFVDGIVRQPNEALQLLSEDRANNVVYPILATNRLLWAPANTAKNLLVSLLTRTHRDPFEGRNDEKERHMRWTKVAIAMVDSGVFVGNEHRQYTIEESAAMMGSRGNRILAANQVDMLQGPIHLKKSASLKWNETISARKVFGNVTTMKPRPIVNLDPIYHARTSPFARSVTDHLHQVFDGKIFVIGKVSVRIHFASGYNQDKLSLMSADFFTGIACIAASGDDSVAYIPGVGFVEADQSMFDQSQDDGPLKHYGFRWMKQAGLPDEFISLVYECCTKRYTVRKHRLQVKGKAGTQMPTGITMTTAINSMDTIAMYVYLLIESQTRSLTVDQAGHELGFTVKSQTKSNFGELTFLKGWWRQDVCGTLTWLPLPSAVLKLGKILRDPVDITKTDKTIKGKRSTTRLSAVEAVRQVAFCLARSYGLVPLDYPVFGAFLAALLRLGSDPGRNLGHLEESWKPKVTTIIVLDREEAVAAMVERYSIEPSWIEEVESLFNGLSSLPAYVEHPLFDRLCDLDY